MTNKHFMPQGGAIRTTQSAWQFYTLSMLLDQDDLDYTILESNEMSIYIIIANHF
jgi:hypothetical protein